MWLHHLLTHGGWDKMAAIFQTTCIFKCIFLNENARIPIIIHWSFLIENKPAVVQIMACRRPGDKPLSEPMKISSQTNKGTRGKMVLLRKNWSHVKNIRPIIIIFGRSFETMTILVFDHEMQAYIIIFLRYSETTIIWNWTILPRPWGKRAHPVPYCPQCYFNLSTLYKLYCD